METSGNLIYATPLFRSSQQPIEEGGLLDGHSPPMVFVTGASRSGTTMLARVLGAHSEIMTFNELHYFGSLWDPHDDNQHFSGRDLSELAATLLARQTHGLWGGRPSEVERAWGRRLVRDLPPDQCNPASLFAAVMRRLTEDAGKTFACEQTPRNIFYARRLLEIYPDARVVNIVRDPRAVLASQKNRWKLRRLGARHLPISEMLRNRVNYHPVTMGQLWKKAAEEAAHLVEHSRCSVIRFEDLAEAPDSSIRQLCGWLGLPFEHSMLDVPRWGSSNMEHTSDRKGVSTEVVSQWRSALSKGETEICEKITHRMMQHFGYTPEFLGRTSPLTKIPSLLSYPLHVAGVMALNPRRALVQLQAVVRSRTQSGKI